jgi:hypothetical protein
MCVCIPAGKLYAIIKGLPEETVKVGRSESINSMRTVERQEFLPEPENRDTDVEIIFR